MDEEELQQQREAERRAGTDAERQRIRAIDTMANKFGKIVDNADDLARAAREEGKTADEFRQMLLEAADKRAAKPLNEQARGADIGLSRREVEGFSILRAVRALADPTNKAARDSAGLEFEASEAAAEKAGKSGERFMIPTDVLRHAVGGDFSGMAVRAPFSAGTAGGADTGGHSIATTLMAGSFIDILRNRATILQLGRVMGGLVGNIDIPKQVAGAQGYWLSAEDAEATETGIELGQIEMTPKTVAAFSEITRKLLKQSSLDVEALVRADLATALALTIDKAGYYGSGAAGQPLGVFNQTGINAVDFAAANAPTFAELVNMETQIATDNADVGSMAYVANAGFRGYAKTTLKFAGVAGTIWEPGNSVNGYRTEITNQINAGDVGMGNFADLLVGLWGGLELTVDPYSNSKRGRLRLVVFQDVDFAIRRAQSFCLGRAVP